MNGKLRVDPKKGRIVMDRTFEKYSQLTYTEEYAHLQRVRQDYPYYPVVRRKIKRNPNKESYDGLTYAYMEFYISTHDNAEENMEIYRQLRMISMCHSKARRFSPIKSWFLEMYPEIKKFGVKKDNAEQNTSATAGEPEVDVIMPPMIPAKSQLPTVSADDVDDAV